MNPADFAALVHARRTNMKVDKERAVPRELVEQLCELAQWAPNHKRTWPWRFCFVTDGRDRFGNVIADVLHDGVPVVIASQCQQAEVLLGHYETGDAIARAGAIGSGDMTLEAAYAKIMFLLSQGVDAADFGTWMRRNITGEISPSSM